MTAREVDNLRIAREHCVSAVKSNADVDERFVTQAKIDFRERLQRLYGLRLTIQSCLKRHEQGPAVQTCVNETVARPSSAQELNWLLAAIVQKSE